MTAATPETNVDDFDSCMEKFGGGRDGKYARRLEAISLVTGPEVLGKMARTYLTGTMLSAYREARETYMGVTGTDRVGVASNVQAGIFVRHSVPGRVAVSPRWSGVQVIRDPYSDASKGEVVLTVIAMQGEPKVLRPNVYKGESFKVV